MTDILVLQREVDKCITCAENHYNRTFHKPVVELSNRMTSTAGVAKASILRLGYNVIIFSQPIYSMNDTIDFHNTTVKHEVAHIVEYLLYGTMGHGRHFNFIMRTVFGDTRTGSLRCHNFKTKQRTVNRYKYKCQSCGNTFNLTINKHNKCIEAAADGYIAPFFHNCGPRGHKGKLCYIGKAVS